MKLNYMINLLFRRRIETVTTINSSDSVNTNSYPDAELLLMKFPKIS